ncbi:ABC transporter ATP-binding protein [Paenibacillus sp. MMS20-IR301]|uniref:ABC transporter ATP-binding protein n=1 Tax=Paenibacillus sp. MMS20-IR301 TaxID=2895946 RepID=UPI0028E391A0|nr:ABC transporter ATP-binding protein [Paenibacillus sp. MMS20-IR301]WNS45192.1 ABC transporter ATP-binding protein [Paenibacillus sp. MMS20-IR301]
MIEFRNVTKDYSRTVAFNDFSMTIEQPGIYCLLGRNGAGKTTMLKMLAGHIEATSGSVAVNNNQVSMMAMPQNVYFAGSAASQFNVKLKELFHIAAEINNSFDTDFALKLAKRLRLDLEKRYKQLSFGMKALTNTLIALASNKEILLLDEPMLGIDPVMRKTFYELLEENCAGKSKIIIVSTHIIDEIEKVAERLLIIDHGRLVVHCAMSEIDEKAYSVTGPAEQVKSATEGLNVIGEITAGGFLSRHVYDKRIDDGDRYSVAALSLQDFFIALVGDERGQPV